MMDTRIWICWRGDVHLAVKSAGLLTGEMPSRFARTNEDRTNEELDTIVRDLDQIILTAQTTKFKINAILSQRIR